MGFIWLKGKDINLSLFFLGGGYLVGGWLVVEINPYPSSHTFSPPGGARLVGLRRFGLVGGLRRGRPAAPLPKR